MGLIITGSHCLLCYLRYLDYTTNSYSRFSETIFSLLCVSDVSILFAFDCSKSCKKNNWKDLTNLKSSSRDSPTSNPVEDLFPKGFWVHRFRDTNDKLAWRYHCHVCLAQLETHLQLVMASTEIWRLRISIRLGKWRAGPLGRARTLFVRGQSSPGSGKSNALKNKSHLRSSFPSPLCHQDPNYPLP